MNKKKIQAANSSNFIGNNNFSSHVHTSLFNTLNILIQIKMKEPSVQRIACPGKNKKKTSPPSWRVDFNLVEHAHP
jgi:hypothetical protein